MTVAISGAVNYDSDDIELKNDPCPMFRQLREEVPPHYDAKHDFSALSLFDDVQAAFLDHETFSSTKVSMPATIP